MAIKNFSEIQNTLRTYDANKWSKSVEFGNKVDLTSTPDEVIKNGRTFGEFLSESVNKVNQMQVDANQKVEMLASGKTSNLHETLLAVEKAEIAFKTMNQVRTKVIDAYREIMKMQV